MTKSAIDALGEISTRKCKTHTRKILETGFPDHKNGTRSTPMNSKAHRMSSPPHSATLPGWTTMTVNTEDSTDASWSGKSGVPTFQNLKAQKICWLRFAKESSGAHAHAAWRQVSDQYNETLVSLLAGGQRSFMTMYRAGRVLRGVLMKPTHPPKLATAAGRT